MKFGVARSENTSVMATPSGGVASGLAAMFFFAALAVLVVVLFGRRSSSPRLTSSARSVRRHRMRFVASASSAK
jgi:hypothetical protein